MRLKTDITPLPKLLFKRVTHTHCNKDIVSIASGVLTLLLGRQEEHQA